MQAMHPAALPSAVGIGLHARAACSALEQCIGRHGAHVRAAAKSGANRAQSGAATSHGALVGHVSDLAQSWTEQG